MADFKRLEVKKKARLVPINHKENSFWDKYQSPIIVKEFAAVTCIDFSPVPPHDYAVTTGSRVQIYSSSNNTIKKTITRFKETASSARFRHDGQLLVAGGDEGVIRIFDMNSRFVLRQLKGHSKPVKSVQFSIDGLHIVSGSDDTVLRYWDIATETSISDLHGHEDYIRSLSLVPSSPYMVLTGSYDHTVRGWDLRSGDSAFKLNHGAPVEAVLVFPSGGTCVTAGGNFVKVWDLLRGGKPFCGFSNHQKTITSLVFDGSHQRILSGGLDRHLKVYSVEDYHVVHNITYPAPILSMAMSPSDSHVTVGMTTRLLSIRHRPHHKIESSLPTDSHASLFAPPRRARGSRPGTQRYFMRGYDLKPHDDDHVVSLHHKPKYDKYELCLKSFNFKQALDAVLEMEVKKRNGKASKVYSVLQELARMDRLHAAIAYRSPPEIIPLIIFLRKNLLTFGYTSFLADVCDIVIDAYGHELSESKELRIQFDYLKQVLSRELRFQREAVGLLGVIDTLLTASTVEWSKGRSDEKKVAVSAKDTIKMDVDTRCL